MRQYYILIIGRSAELYINIPLFFYSYFASKVTLTILIFVTNTVFIFNTNIVLVQDNVAIYHWRNLPHKDDLVDQFKILLVVITY